MNGLGATHGPWFQEYLRRSIHEALGNAAMCRLNSFFRFFAGTGSWHLNRRHRSDFWKVDENDSNNSQRKKKGGKDMSITTNLYACKGFMVLGLWVGCAIFLSPQPAKSQLLKPASPYVPGRYIVLFHEGHAESVPGVITQMSAEIGLHVVHYYDGKGFAGHLSDSALARLRNDPRVAHIEQDQEVRIQAQPDGQRIRTAKGTRSNLVKPKPKAAPVRNSQTIPWGITRINAGNSSTKSGDGAGSVDIDVAVIDTGIDLKHPDLKIVGGKNFSNGGISNYGDGYGHGTHVSGIIAAMDNTIGVVEWPLERGFGRCASWITPVQDTCQV